MKRSFLLFAAAAALISCAGSGKIDRQALVTRNNPHVTEVNPLHSLNLGNGRFTVTLDATGLQTFPEFYKDGLSLGTYSQWGWHSMPNTEGYSYEETLEVHPLAGNPDGVYSVQAGKDRRQPLRNQQAADWIRSNPQRMHLGNFGFAGMKPEEISGVSQTLDMWDGVLHSSFDWNGTPVEVTTVGGGEGCDAVSAKVRSEKPLPVVLRFPYPTGAHTDDASDWNADDRHSTEIVERHPAGAVLKRTLDESIYYVSVSWNGNASLEQDGPNRITLSPEKGNWEFSVVFSQEQPSFKPLGFKAVAASARELWNGYWKTTGVVDFSQCTDERAPLLEKRVVLSQYLIRVQEAQDFPPAETGMTYNSWFGKFHLEMVMWHTFHYATWNKPDLRERQLRWYKTAVPNARMIARRQGYKGLRWMKMTDPSAAEAPSDVGSYIIWQQPHPIYMAELLCRAEPSQRVLDEYFDIVQESAEFMADFVSWDEENGRYIIQGACAANEALNEEVTVNPAFELSYWHFGISVAQTWRKRKGLPRVKEWDEVCEKLAPLPMSPDGIYLPAEKGPGIPDFKNGTVEVTVRSEFNAPAGGFLNAQRPRTETRTVKLEDLPRPYVNRAASSQNLLAYGMLPSCRLFTEKNMQETLQRAYENWNWNSNQWSWNYPSFIMNATRLYRSDIAVRAATMDGRSDMLLPSGNNYRSEKLRMYLPGNGGLLLAVGMMCAGWDGCTEENPGFPKDGTWNVRWENISPMP